MVFDGPSSLFLLELQREPHVAVVALAFIVGLLRIKQLPGNTRLGLVGLALVLVHFVATVLLIQVGSTGCHGCMIWSVPTHMTLSDQILPGILAGAWLLIVGGLLGVRGLWPNNSSKPTPLRGAA